MDFCSANISLFVLIYARIFGPWRCDTSVLVRSVPGMICESKGIESEVVNEQWCCVGTAREERRIVIRRVKGGIWGKGILVLSEISVGSRVYIRTENGQANNKLFRILRKRWRTNWRLRTVYACWRMKWMRVEMSGAGPSSKIYSMPYSSIKIRW